MKTQAIVVAAGQGTRLNSALPKALILLEGKPLVSYALRVLQKSSLIQSIIVVGAGNYLTRFEKIVKQNHLSKVKKIIPGGKTRRESVACGLLALDNDTKRVLIHDSARPFVTQKLIARCLVKMGKEKGVVAAVPVKPTIKAVHPKTFVIEKTLERSCLWEIQTPQVFSREVICRAHRRIKDKNPSDDALLVEKLGFKVKVVLGDYQNIKVTTKEDLIFAKAILFSQRKKGQ